MSLLSLKKAPKTLVESLDEKAVVLATTREAAESAGRYHQTEAIAARRDAETARLHEDAVSRARSILDDAGVVL